MPKVTVIMPSLNVVRYIKPCLESVLGQTLQDMEILAIDAGSQDGTLELLEEYARADKRIRVIHSDKKSYGYQINLGIRLAQGEYVGIVETDDKISPDMYMELYTVAVSQHAEYVKGGAARFVSLKNGAEWKMPVWNLFSEPDMAGNVIKPADKPDLLVSDTYLWAGIYKKDFIKKILLNETPGAAFQDQGFLFQTISSAVRAVYLDKVVYWYRQDNDASSVYHPKSFRYLAEEYAFIEKFLSGKEDCWRHVYYRRMLDQCLGRFRTMAASGRFWEKAVPDMEILQKRLLQAVENGLIQRADMGFPQWERLRLFLTGPEEIYMHYVHEFQEKTAPVYCALKAMGRRPAVIFGCSRFGKFVHVLLDSVSNGEVLAYCDHCKQIQYTQIQGVPVLPPKEAVEKHPNAVYIVAGRRGAEEMVRQLLKLGISENQICQYWFEEDLLLLWKIKSETTEMS